MNGSSYSHPFPTRSPDQLDVAMRVVASFTAAISTADTKAALLFPPLGIALASVYARAGAVRASFGHPSLAGALASAVFIVFVCCTVVTVVLLAATLTPRTDSLAEGENVFSFPSYRGGIAGGRPEIGDLRAQAWAQAELLATIATRKYARLRTAFHWSTAAAVAFLSWSALLWLIPA